MATATETHGEEMTPSSSNSQTMMTGMIVTSVVATATCGRYLVAREVVYSVKSAPAGLR